MNEFVKSSKTNVEKAIKIIMRKYKIIKSAETVICVRLTSLGTPAEPLLLSKRVKSLV